MKHRTKNASELGWCAEALEAAKTVREAIKGLPFVTELAAGTLPAEKFYFYLRQDALYLGNYSRVLAAVASRLTDTEASGSFLRFAADGIAVESALHGSYLAEAHDGATAEATPTCLLYMSYLASLNTAPVEIQAAAVLPCFLVYLETGRYIASMASPGNHYERWIATYADDSFAESCARASEICNELAAGASDEVRREMTRAFVTATKMEWMFWESAYNLEKWKV